MYSLQRLITSVVLRVSAVAYSENRTTRLDAPSGHNATLGTDTSTNLPLLVRKGFSIRKELMKTDQDQDSLAVGPGLGSRMEMKHHHRIHFILR
jgi:hypothetical protein